MLPDPQCPSAAEQQHRRVDLHVQNSNLEYKYEARRSQVALQMLC